MLRLLSYIGTCSFCKPLSLTRFQTPEACNRVESKKGAEGNRTQRMCTTLTFNDFVNALGME